LTRANGGRKVRVGLVGCGLVAQVMHLPYLRELSDRYEIGALCDLSDDVRRACSERYGVGRTTNDWVELLDADLDALFVLTSGSHAPVAVAAAEAGLHVFVEKPMCFSAAEGAEMIAAARRADVRLMVGYMKRYDPAYERLCEERPFDDVRLIRVTTLESPLAPYVEHYPLVASGAVDGDVLAALKADDAERIRTAVGDDPVAARAYRAVLLDSLVHELNALRGVLGEPDRLEFADLRETGVSLELTFGDAHCTLSWVDLPGIARYDQEFAFYAPNRRLTLSFPSPFLRSAPTLLTIEGGEVGTPRSWRTVETAGYDEAFKRELVEFHRCIVEGDEPRTSGIDGLRDVALCQAVVRSHLEHRLIESPTAGTVGSPA
jgi:predicted dehydrogenase